MSLEFHKGIDYAVVMRPSESTEDALCRLYGEDRHVTKFGNLFAAAPNLLAALKAARVELEAYEQAATGETYNNVALNAAIAKAEGTQP